MQHWVVGQLRGDSGRRQTDLLELYCGNGCFTVALAPNFRHVVATELSKAVRTILATYRTPDACLWRGCLPLALPRGLCVCMAAPTPHRPSTHRPHACMCTYHALALRSRWPLRAKTLSPTS